jgi:hypothetical protein
MTVQMPPDMVRRASVRLGAILASRETRVQCLRDGQHDDEHHAALDALDRRRSLFVRWSHDGVELVELDDCMQSSPDGMDGCSLFAGHSEPHTWEHLQ